MMIGNYLKIALSVLRRQKLYSLINVAGLGVGLSCFMLIALFLRHEFSYESGFADADRIYRVSRDYYASGDTSEARPMGNAARVAELLEQDFTQVESAARIFCCGAVVKTGDGEPILEGKYAQADNELFEIFDFEWISGDSTTALTEPYTIVLTRSAAERHFGGEDPLGQTLFYGGGGDLQPAVVTGVIEDLPDNTHLDFDFLESMLSWTDCRCDFQEQLLQNHYNWDNNFYITYIKLAEGADIDAVQGQSDAFFERYLAEGASSYTGFTAMPISDIYLHSDRDSEAWSPDNAERRGNYVNLVILASVAVLVLVLACINFVNLTTARVTQRMKEVGVRKVSGAIREQLMQQFLVESALLTILSLVLAIALVDFSLPAYSAFLEVDLAFDYLTDSVVLSSLCLLALIVAMAAGGYPAFYLASIRPEQALKATRLADGNGVLRKALVVFQFAISIAVIAATSVTYLQLQYVNNLDLGFDRDNVLLVSPNALPSERWQTLKTELLANPDILAVTSSTWVPFQASADTARIRRSDNNAATRMDFLRTDYDFFSAYGAEFLAGREFSPDMTSDFPVAADDSNSTFVQSFIINESAALALGWSPEAALGQEIIFDDIEAFRLLGALRGARGRVVGVVRDMKFQSAYGESGPAVYFLPRFPQMWASIKLSGNNVAATAEFVRDTWREIFAEVPVTQEFLSAIFDRSYRDEQKLRQSFAVFSLLTILIACLGLLGLASYAAERRAKEIGIRKVMGSSVWGIVRLLTADFSKLVLLSNLIAWPVAYFAMNRWLENFAYRIDLTPLIFIGSGLIALCIAWVTVGGTAARAASRKPVLALRYE